jgi:cold shock CspA family protein
MSTVQTTARFTYTPRPRLKAGKTQYEGVVRGASPDRTYAFIASQLGDIFVHFRAVKTINPDGSRSLSNGDFVTFYLVEPELPRGPQALHVRRVPER